MTMTILLSNGVGYAPTMIGLKTYLVHCGNYRHFEVDAQNEKEALKRFNKIQPSGFTKKDVTKIEAKFI